MSYELKPCPFCGCEVKIRHYNHLGAKYVIVPMTKHKPWCSLNGVKSKWFSSSSDAVDSWNTREGGSE